MRYDEDGNWHKSLLATIASRMKPKCFIELGLWKEPALLDVAQHCESVHGVDPMGPAYDVPSNATIHAMTTDEFFDGPAKELIPDLVFVDADHRSHQVMKDLDNISMIAAENCIVVIHDTYPPNADHTADGFCSDSYKVPKLLMWENVTLPFPPGVTIVRMHPRSLV